MSGSDTRLSRKDKIMKLIIDGIETIARADESLIDICERLGLMSGKLSVDPIAAKIAGGSAAPISLLKIAGVDMSSPEPVNNALKLFGELIDEMEALC